MISHKQCLVIEDDVVNANYIADGFKRHGYKVEVIHNGVDALGRMLDPQLDLIILDRMLPNNIDGLSLLTTMRSQGVQTPVLVLSALSALDDRVKGLKVGGDDYLTKPFDLPELLARSDALIRRAKITSEEVNELVLGDLRVDLTHSLVERAGVEIRLQIREFKLLVFLLNNAGQIVTRSMLLEAVWGYSFDPQTNVIDVQISRLRNKIDKPFSYPLLHTIRGEGYMLKSLGHS